MLCTNFPSYKLSLHSQLQAEKNQKCKEKEQESENLFFHSAQRFHKCKLEYLQKFKVATDPQTALFQLKVFPISTCNF